MKKIKNITIGGIQQKIFNLVLIMILLVMAAYSVVIIYQINHLNQLVTETNEKQKRSITDLTGQTIDGVISASLGRTTQMEAEIANDMFKGVANIVRVMADNTEKLFRNPENYIPYPVSLPDAADEGNVTVQLLMSEGTDPESPEISGKLELLGNISPLLAALYKYSDVSACYVALPEGVMLMADDHASSKYAEDGSLITIPITERDWYKGAAESGKLFFTDVVADIFTGQIGITCAMPIYHNGELAAVAGADFFLDQMAAAVSNLSNDTSETIIINDEGHVVFSPRTEGLFHVKVGSESPDLRKSSNRELAALITESLISPTDISLVEIDGESFYMTGAPVKTIGWTILNSVSKAAADQPAVRMEEQYNIILNDARDTFRQRLTHASETITVLLLVVTVLALSGALTVAKRIVQPLEAITRRVQKLGGEDLRFRMEDTYRTGDEIEILAESFANLSSKTLQYVEQVKTVTAEKERIGAELNMAKAIQTSQLPRLFPAFPDRPEFDIFASMTPAKAVGGDFYDFFLIDDDHIALVMADVSGKGVPAALFMMVSRVLIKSRIQNGESPAEALAHVNNQLCKGNDVQYFVTVWLAVLEISTGKGISANAGHEHPTICRANGRFELVMYRHSVAVAAMEGITFRQHEFELHPGDSLFVYTDGVPDATNSKNELFGTDRMLAALNRQPDAKPEKILSNVMDGINEFVAGSEQFDDITMLCLKYIGPKM